MQGAASLFGTATCLWHRIGALERLGAILAVLAGYLCKILRANF